MSPAPARVPPAGNRSISVLTIVGRRVPGPAHSLPGAAPALGTPRMVPDMDCPVSRGGSGLENGSQRSRTAVSHLTRLQESLARRTHLGIGHSVCRTGSSSGQSNGQSAASSHQLLPPAPHEHGWPPLFLAGEMELPFPRPETVPQFVHAFIFQKHTASEEENQNIRGGQLRTRLEIASVCTVSFVCQTSPCLPLLPY